MVPQAAACQSAHLAAAVFLSAAKHSLRVPQRRILLLWQVVRSERGLRNSFPPHFQIEVFFCCMCVIDYPCQGKNYVDTDLCQLHFGEAGSPSIFCVLWKFSSSFITCCPSLPPLALPLMNPRRNEALGRVFCIPHSWPC